MAEVLPSPSGRAKPATNLVFPSQVTPFLGPATAFEKERFGFGGRRLGLGGGSGAIASSGSIKSREQCGGGTVLIAIFILSKHSKKKTKNRGRVRGLRPRGGEWSSPPLALACMRRGCPPLPRLPTFTRVSASSSGGRECKYGSPFVSFPRFPQCDGGYGRKGFEAARKIRLGGYEQGENAFCSKRKVVLSEAGRVGHRSMALPLDKGKKEKKENQQFFGFKGTYNGDFPECWEEQVVARATINLDVETAKEVYENEQYFAKLWLIGRFQGLWPSLGELHKWISETWGLVLEGNLQIYPGARGFFVASWWREVSPLHYLVEKDMGSTQKEITNNESSLSGKEKPYLKALNKEVYKGKEDKQQADSSPSNPGMMEESNKIEVPPKNSTETGTISSCEVTHKEAVRSLGLSRVPLSSIQENLSQEGGWEEVRRKKERKAPKESHCTPDLDPSHFSTMFPTMAG
ncbi:hypothetical protein SUGI_1048470 [Cryptomeria japonica]|nr:hypothetical protein SUGI_1048470 [Cryptomeria japonica]